MATPKRCYWLKLKSDFFKSKEVRKLRKLAGGEMYAIIYLEMMLLAIQTDGKLIYEGIGDSFAEELALELNEDVKQVSVVVDFLTKRKLLIDVGNSEFLLTQVLTLIGTENESAARMRRLRARRAVSGYAVYKYFNKNNECLYIGQTRYPYQRYLDHCSENEDYLNVAFVEIAIVDTLEDALETEAEAIAKCHPKHNIAGKKYIPKSNFVEPLYTRYGMDEFELKFGNNSNSKA